ncbi:MAG TPA: cobalt ECF transporter T component CbiQ [Thermodesulfobacteriota bacterium]|nr:cobalt ECF transporter T component CbiQ [Thermodesulfobacteriota bacterium]
MSKFFKRKNHDFIERSLRGALSFFKESVFAEEYALQKGLLQSLDPRIKTITFFLFLVSVLLTKNIFVLLALYALCLLLTHCSNIGLRFFLKRTWIFIPLFSLFIAVPALFSVFTPGDAWVSVKIGALSITITKQGFWGALLFVVRVTTAVSFVVLLSITTKHVELLRVLRIFRIPQLFVMTLGMCYRYLYLLVELVENTYQAIKSRVGSVMHYKKGQTIVAWNIALLWRRSYSLNEQVYNAMLSRGYSGDVRLLHDGNANLRDWLWLLWVVILFTVMLYCTVSGKAP